MCYLASLFILKWQIFFACLFFFVWYAPFCLLRAKNNGREVQPFETITDTSCAPMSCRHLCFEVSFLLWNVSGTHRILFKAGLAKANQCNFFRSSSCKKKKKKILRSWAAELFFFSFSNWNWFQRTHHSGSLCSHAARCNSRHFSKRRNHRWTNCVTMATKRWKKTRNFPPAKEMSFQTTLFHVKAEQPSIKCWASTYVNLRFAEINVTKRAVAFHSKVRDMKSLQSRTPTDPLFSRSI